VHRLIETIPFDDYDESAGGKLPEVFRSRRRCKLRGLELAGHGLIVEGYVSGVHRSPFHGFSIEFASIANMFRRRRALRRLESLRQDRQVLPQAIREETNLISYLLLDGSQSMSYRSPAAALSKLGILPMPGRGAGVFDFESAGQRRAGDVRRAGPHVDPPSGNPSHLKQLLHVHGPNRAGGKDGRRSHFSRSGRTAQKRGIVLVFSDLFDSVPAILAGLKHFRHRRHEVVLFHVLDPAELDFPFQQMTLFKGLEQFPNLLAEPHGLRRAYLEQFGNFLQAIREGCREHRIDYVQIRTDQPLDIALSAYLTQRMQRSG